MQIGRTLGHDELTSEMVKYINEERHQEFLDILNQAKVEKKVLLEWQINIITPIYKKDEK